MQLQGKLIEIFDTQQITEKFSKREFVIECAENPEYPEFLKLEMIQDKCDHLDGYNIGQMVEVDVNIKGRKWTNPQGEDKYFNTLQAWRLRSKGGQEAPPPPQQQQQQPKETETDDLPF